MRTQTNKELKLFVIYCLYFDEKNLKKLCLKVEMFFLYFQYQYAKECLHFMANTPTVSVLRSFTYFICKKGSLPKPPRS